MTWKINREDGMGIWTIPFYGTIFGSGILAFVVIRTVNRRSDQIFQHSLIPRPSRIDEPPTANSDQVQRYLRERTAIVAALVMRAGSEIAFQNRNPGGAVGIGVRGAVNAVLRHKKLWNQCEAQEAELFRTPDGLWPDKQRNLLPEWCEQLRLLRWALGIDIQIEPLAHLPKPELDLCKGILDSQQFVIARKELPESWELRAERDTAREYAMRVFAEQVKREPVESGDSPLEATPRMPTSPSTDFIAGTRVVGELDENNLQLLGVCAIARYRYAGYLMDLLHAQIPVSYRAWLAANQLERSG